MHVSLSHLPHPIGCARSTAPLPIGLVALSSNSISSSLTITTSSDVKQSVTLKSKAASLTSSNHPSRLTWSPTSTAAAPETWYDYWLLLLLLLYNIYSPKSVLGHLCYLEIIKIPKKQIRKCAKRLWNSWYMGTHSDFDYRPGLSVEEPLFPKLRLKRIRTTQSILDTSGAEFCCSLRDVDSDERRNDDRRHCDEWMS